MDDANSLSEHTKDKAILCPKAQKQQGNDKIILSYDKMR